MLREREGCVLLKAVASPLKANIRISSVEGHEFIHTVVGLGDSSPAVESSLSGEGERACERVSGERCDNGIHILVALSFSGDLSLRSCFLLCVYSPFRVSR